MKRDQNYSSSVQRLLEKEHRDELEQTINQEVEADQKAFELEFGEIKKEILDFLES